MPEQPQPYVGPRPFKREDASFFFGRTRESNELLSLVISHTEVLLYAQSGAGKTSLINAKLLSLLEEGEGLEVLPLATMRGPPSTMSQSQIANIYVFNTLVSWTKGAAPPEKLAKMTLREFLEQREQPMDKEGLPKPCVAIFDQFEELFTSYREHWEQRRGFFEQVRDALDANPRLRTLFAMRDDYVAAIDRYARIMPEEFRIRFHLENLREPQALDAIKGPLTRDERHHFAQGVAEKLVKELIKTPVETASGQTESITGEFVEPIMLQVVCERLWRDLKPEETEITFAHLETISVEKALLGFYEESIQAVALETGIAEGTLRSWFEKHLVTPAGTRGMVFRGETETEGLRNDAVDALDKLHLIRSELRGGAEWYELTHDRFIEAIQRSNEVWFEQRAVSEALRSKLEAKAQIPGAFLDESETRDAEAFLTSPDARILGPSPQVESLVRASRLHVEEEKASKARELEDARRLADSEHARAQMRSRLALTALLFALAACVAFAYSIYEWQKAINMQRQAEIQGLASYLTAEAYKHQRDQLDLALLLSTEAYRVAGTMHPPKKLRLMKSRLLADAKTSLLQGLASSSHLLQFAHGHGDAIPIRSIVSTKDGRLIFTGNADGTVTGWNSAGIPVTQPLQQHTDKVSDLALSPDERTLASASVDGKILLWDVAAMQKKPLRLNAEGDRTDGGVSGIGFSPDGKSIVSAGLNGAITLWDVAARRRIDSVPGGHGKTAYRAIFNPAGDRIASCGANNVVKLWKIDSGKLVLVKELAGHPEGYEIFGLAFSPDGSILVSAGQDGTVVRWRLTESEPAAEPLHDEQSQTAHWSAVYGVAFSADGKIVASGGADQTIRFWDAATGEAIKTDFTGYGQTIYCLAFRPQTQKENRSSPRKNPTGILLAGTATGAFTIWDPTQEQSILSLEFPFGDWVARVRFDPGGHKVASCVGENGGILVTDLTTFDSEELKGHSERVQSFAFAPDGRTCAAGAVDGKLLLWDSAPGAAPNSLNAIPSLPWDSAPGAARSDLDAILSQPIYVIPLSEPIYVLLIYKLPISQPIYVLPISEPVDALAYTPDSKILVSGGPADQILVWDVSSRKLLRRLERNGSKRVVALAFSPPDGRTLAVASEDREVALWNVADWHLRPKTLHHKRGSLGLPFSPGLAFSPDGKKLATSAENEIILWDVERATQLGPPLRKHVGNVNALAFSPNREILASGGQDNSVILWDVATRLLTVLPTKYSAFVASVTDVAFSPDGRRLAVAGRNTTLWYVNFDSWQCRAAEMAGRNLTHEEWSNYFQDEPYRPTFPYGLMLEAHKQALRGEAGEARRDYAEAVKTAARTKDMTLNNAIAWWGTLDGFADVVLPACDVAIREAPVYAKPGMLDTRGVALACTGKLREAADDLQKFVDSEKTMDPDSENGKQRGAWVAELRKGHNPIDKKTLEALRIED